MRDVDFGVCLLLFFLFFLSLGSVCGVDGGIADDVAIVDEIGCDGSGIVCVGSENGVVNYSLEYDGDVDVLSEGSSYDYDKEDCYFRADDMNMYYHDGSKFEVYLEDAIYCNPLSNSEVIFSINGVNYTRITDSQGYASLTINLDSGTYWMKMYFNGNDEYNPVMNLFKITVKPTVYGEDIVKYYRNGTQYYSVFLNYHGEALVNYSVNFNINGVIYTKITNSTGWATLAINLQPGIYIITASNIYTGETHGNKITVLSTIISKDLVKYYRNGTQFEVQFLNDKGIGLKNTQITFNIGGNIYTPMTNTLGIAKLNINLDPGRYIITSINPFNGEQKGNNITVLPILQSENLTMNYKNGKYRVKLVDGMGNRVNNASVRFNINGVYYTRVTNNFGVAYLNINLNPGSYIVTADYKGCYISNTIKVVNSGAASIMDRFSINYDGGFYSASNLTVDIFSDMFTGVYYSLDNSTWFSDLCNVTFDFKSGIYDLYYYFDYDSSVKFHKHYVVGNGTPFVWASYGSGIYENSFYVNLSVVDDKDINPKIYYTLDGNVPTVNSNIYEGSIFISSAFTHVYLRFFSVDKYNYKSSIVNVHYFFGNLIANINNGKYYNTLQSAIDDMNTNVGDVLEVSKDLNESVVLNKSLYIRSCDFKSVDWYGVGYCIWIKNNAVNSIIDSFIFHSINQEYGAVVLQNATNCLVANSNFNVVGYSAVYSFGGGLFNSLVNNSFLYGNNFVKYSISVDGGSNCYILNNRINGSEIGIYAINTNNSIFNGNNVVNTTIGAIQCNGTNNTLSYNNLTGNVIGISISGSFCEIISNIIVKNTYCGIKFIGFVENFDVHFNSISCNSLYNVYANGSCVNVNATYNWWGYNNYAEILHDIFNESGFIIAPYLYLYSYVSSYKVQEGIIVGATICSNLNYAIGGGYSQVEFFNVYDISQWGCVMDGIVISLDNKYYAPLHDGKAYFDVIFNKNSTRNFVVYLDNAFNNVVVANNSLAHIEIISDAFVHGSDDIFHYSFDLSLNESINWVNIIWKFRDCFESEINLMINGAINKTFIVDSSFYRSVKDDYRSCVFDAVNLYNKFTFNEMYSNLGGVFVWIALNFDKHNLEEVNQSYRDNDWSFFKRDELSYLLDLNNKTKSDVLLELIKNSYGLSDDEVSFIKNNASKFQDNIYSFVGYFGDESKEFYIDTGKQNEMFSWVGDMTIRRGCISYVDGSYAHEVGSNSTVYYDNWVNTHLSNGTVLWNYKYDYGYYVGGEYDGFMTFTFANNRVDDSILRYWLNQKDKTYDNGSLVYSNGFMKAAYGGFIEGLLVIYWNDLVADISALRYNVTWERVSPMVMSVRDDFYQTVLSGESSFNFGRCVVGDVDNVRAFNFACSSTFSPIEHYVASALFPNGGDNGSATVGLGFILESGGVLEVIMDDGYVLIRMNDSNRKVLLYDIETGILRDMISGVYGSYCYSNQQTEWGVDLGNEILENKDMITEYLNSGDGDLSGLSNPLMNLLKSSNLFTYMGDLIIGELFDSVYNRIIKIGIINPLNTIKDILMYAVGDFFNTNLNEYVERYVADPKFWAGIGGGLLFDAGKIAIFTGVGAPVGLALMGVGTFFTAYSCGLFDMDSEGNYVGLTGENMGNFAFSMGCNIIGSGDAAYASRIAFKSMGGEVLQQSTKRVVSASSYGGYYRTVLRSDTKIVSFKNPAKTMPAKKYLMDETVGDTNVKKLGKLGTEYICGVGGDYIWRGIWESQYSNN